MSAYNRVTCAGYNTGKLIIGSCHIPRPRPMYPDEYVIQELLISKRMPRKRVCRAVVQQTGLWVYRCITQIISIAQKARKSIGRGE